MPNVFRNVTKSSLSQGVGIWTVLAAALGVALTQWGYLGFFLTGIPLWGFGVLGSAGGTLFHLGPMLFGSASIHPPRETKTTEELFLYLRPFELDARSSVQLMIGASAGVLLYLGLLQELLWAAAFVPLIVNVNKEQNFQDAFTSLGRFIAFGKPREWLRPLGASRVYAGTGWKPEIKQLMSQARVVIVRPGESKSIKWEIKQVRRLVPPERIVFYLKFRGRKKRRQRAYQSFRDHLESKYPTKLPEQLGRARFLIFDHSWQPHFVEDKNGPTQLLQEFFSRSGDATSGNLRPLLKALNLELPVRQKDLLSNLWRILVLLIVLPSIGLVPLSIMYATVRVLSALILFLLSNLVR